MHISKEAEQLFQGLVPNYDGTLLDLQPFDIDELAERFPDCEVGY